MFPEKRCSEKDLDVDKEWQLFAEQHPVVKSRFDWRKLAASFIGVCLLSCIAFAAIHTFSSHRQVEETSAGDTSQVKVVSSPNTAAVSDKATSSDVKKEIVHKTFDNVSLETMLGEMAEYYGVKIVFQNQEAKQLRFYYEWNSENSLQSVVDELNHSQQIILSLDNEQLKDLDKATRRYKISFIYNELEDFTVTTSFRNLDLQEALGRVFGFYPMKATIEDSLIFVECTQKEPTKLMGRVIDERHRPVEFANVALLNPRDSSFLTGGVTNASGNFVIPCGMKKVLAKVSCVGYYTLYNIYNVGKVGNVVLKESTMHINGVTVKAKLPSFKMGREGMLIDIQHSDLSKVGDAVDVLRQLPRINVSSTDVISVYGKGTPIIYINNKQVRDSRELQRLKSDAIKNVEIITSPGARYDATVSSVIRIRTVKKQGEGMSGFLPFHIL